MVKRGRKRDQNDQRSVSRVNTVSLEPTIHEIPRSLEPASQYLLWIDGVGGFLVCLSHRVTLGQANPESIVDIPLLADVSRHHATLQRDAEGYFLEAIRKVLVPILDLGASVRAVELAARLNQGHKAEMVIVYVHEIPLQAPLVMPEKDPRIQRALDAAAFIATQHAIAPRTKVNVARQAGHRIVEIAREENADLIVMGISHQNRPNESPLGRVAEHVVRNAHCEVVVDRVPRQKVSPIPSEFN